MQILIYECPEAPKNTRFCAKYLKNNMLLPAVTFRATRAEVQAAAEAFLNDLANGKPLKRVEVDAPVREPVRASGEFEDLL